jgi:hypothetical protein
MATATLASTDDVLAGLTRHFQGNDLSVRPVCTRILLRTGVNLREPRADQRTDASLIARVCAELQAMGISV